MILPLPAPVLAETLRFQVEAPRKVTVGETFRVRAWLVNGSKAAVVLAKPNVLTMGLGTRFSTGLYRAGERVATEIGGKWSGQWFVSRAPGANAFLSLSPGEQVLVEDIRYGQEYASGVTPSLISEIADAKLKPLEPGEYTLRVAYSFERELDRPPKPGPYSQFRPRLTTEAKALYAKAWTGALTRELPVTVSPGL